MEDLVRQGVLIHDEDTDTTRYSGFSESDPFEVISDWEHGEGLGRLWRGVLSAARHLDVPISSASAITFRAAEQMSTPQPLVDLSAPDACFVVDLASIQPLPHRLASASASNSHISTASHSDLRDTLPKNPLEHVPEMNDHAFWCDLVMPIMTTTDDDEDSVETVC